MTKFKELEVVSLVKNQLFSRTEFYQLYSQLDDFSGGARIAEIRIIEVSYEIRERGRVCFWGTLLVETIKEIGIKNLSFTGTFEGYIDEVGIFLDSASLVVGP